MSKPKTITLIVMLPGTDEIEEMETRRGFIVVPPTYLQVSALTNKETNKTRLLLKRKIVPN